jgi:hypothetical protein
MATAHFRFGIKRRSVVKSAPHKRTEGRVNKAKNPKPSASEQGPAIKVRLMEIKKLDPSKMNNIARGLENKLPHFADFASQRINKKAGTQKRVQIADKARHNS